MSASKYPSPYREAEALHGTDPDAFFKYLEEHRHDDPSLAVGWALKRAERWYNLDQTAVAARTGVTDRWGVEIERPITKSYVSAMLVGRTNVSPGVYRRLAEACHVNVIHFHLAEGWEDEADIAAYSYPDQELAHPILSRIIKLPRERRAHATAVVTAVLDSIQDFLERERANDDASRRTG